MWRTLKDKHPATNDSWRGACPVPVRPGAVDYFFRSKRSLSMTFAQALAKSVTNFS